MKCPFCGASSTHIRVIDTREVTDGIRRRRECDQCNQRFTTYERVASMNLLVIKRDGRREEFDREIGQKHAGLLLQAARLQRGG